MITSIIIFVIAALGMTTTGEHVAYVQQLHQGKAVGPLVRVAPASSAWNLLDTIQVRTYVEDGKVRTDTTIVLYRGKP